MRVRVLTFRYVGALAVVAGLLIAGQALVQRALDRQEGDARVVNMAGRQRMLGQRLCMLLLAVGVESPARAQAALDELSRVADDWERSQAALRAGRPGAGLAIANSDAVDRLFAQIDTDHRAMLTAARAVPTAPPGAARAAHALAARAHQDAFLAGMDRIVDEYEREARDRVVELRRVELALLVLVLVVLALEGAFVFRPAVRGLSAHLAALDLAQRAMLQISDREQIRIAQDLHDGLGQHLVGIAFLLRSLRRELGAGGPADRVDEIDQLLAEAIDHTRGLARGLHPHTLEAAGLAAALGELAVHTERVFGVVCRVTSHVAGAEPPVPERAHLHRIAREAVLNAAKHAGARTIDIELVRDGSRLTLVVRDDGVGIGERSPDGMGLHLMEYRAKMMGGSLQITAGGERRGTTVTCSIMLRDRPAPRATA